MKDPQEEIQIEDSSTVKESDDRVRFVVCTQAQYDQLKESGQLED